MNPWLVLLPHAAADRIAAITAGWGHLNVSISRPDRLAGIVGVSEREVMMAYTALDVPTGHPLTVSDTEPYSGVWHRGQDALQTAWLDCMLRASALPTERFRELVTHGWVSPPADRGRFTLIYTPGDKPRFSAWWVSRVQAEPANLDVLARPGLGWAQLAPGWPTNVVRGARVAVIGVGSIGAVAADALAGYGIGTLSLIDPDRLLSHNLIRHLLTARDLGRAKVDGLADHLRRAWPETAVEPLELDVVADADRIRPLLHESALVLCAADGVLSRRVTSHLARRAAIPAVLACVLEGGEIGEVIRLQPWPTVGCLTCQRQHLAESGSFAPEPALDAPYGAGSEQRPMTAVPADLHLIGQLAAKIAVATLLERAGYHDQLLPGDHVLTALRPRTDLPEPADLRRATEQRWIELGPPIAGCPTCAPEAAQQAPAAAGE